MSSIPPDLKYTSKHEWLKIDGDTALVGVTDHAQESLGDVTFVDLPRPGEQFSQDDSFGVVESVKAASDLYMPVDAKVLEINADLEDAPERVNEDPYGAAWMLKIKLSDPAQLESLLSAEAYSALL